MSAVPDRRPLLASSLSAPDVFCRPMDPAPAPLVYINGWHGIGKETVAECLTLLLGKDKSLLIDVRSVGREPASDNCCGGAKGVSKHNHHRRHEHNPLLTPEHPRYFAFDLDCDAHSLSPLPSPSFSFTSSAYSPPASRSGSFSSDSTATTSTSSASATPTTIKTTPTPATTTASSPVTAIPSPTITATPSTNLSGTTATTTATTTTTAFPSPTTTLPIPTPIPIPTPCSTQNLTALLTSPANRRRIAVLPACAPDTPSGRAALRIFEAAAALAGRPFVGVSLRCEEGAYRDRVGARAWRRGPCGGGGSAAGRGRRLGSVGSLEGVLLASSSAAAAASGLAGLEIVAGEGGGGGEIGVVDGPCAGGGGCREGRARLLSLPGSAAPGPGSEVGVSVSLDPGVCWTQGHGPGRARPMKAGLTVDVTCVPAFEAALQIVEFVRGLEAERDAELCSNGGSAVTTPGCDTERERKLEASGPAAGM